MIIYYILCNIFFLPSIYSSDATLPKVDQTETKIWNNKDLLNNKTKLQSGNVSILPDKAVLTSKDNITLNLLNLEEGFSKIKEKPVHARKGADPLDDADTKNNISVDLNTLDKGSSIPDNTDINFRNSVNSTVNISNEHKKNNSASKSSQKTPEMINAEQLEEIEKKPKKPYKTVYETLASLAQGPVTAKTSIQTLISDQIPSPKKDASVGKTPGMITPIVITILVVPMFAVLGYMALRRGQEAWKNRHYKRMDFLLDGMYND
ncbi:hypothetical protein K1T71_004954 [Dendrolimus kikuchii]|uniref:Uncharacterized protein n=1 Tax=Dendrolimus kikuchii TaxID=765133 RepID=A0ACC1D782_9NEOP|nr:hypothetical protein K1T71_004954 [Dendrolimus kikuchii]